MTADQPPTVCDTTPTIEHQTYRLLHDVYLLLDNRDRAVLRQFDLTPSQYTLLTLLDTGEGQRLITLSERLLVARSTITRLIDHMESAGLVQRVEDPDDRRAQRVALTPVGDRLLQRACAAHEQSLKSRFDALTDSERQCALELLRKMRTGLRADLDIPDVDI